MPADDAALGYDTRNPAVEVRDPLMNVLIVDDHPLIRSGVKAMLVHHDRHAVVREARKLGEALGMLGEENGAPDLILLDLNLPDCSGLPTLTAIREAAQRTPVVVLSADDSQGTILGSLDRGALGFIPKTMDPDLIWSALGIVLAGGIYLPRETLVEGGCVRPGGCSVGASSSATGGRLSEIGLTDRQIDALRMLVQGYPNKVIARELGITEATVKAHVSAVLRAMKVTSRTQVVIWLAGRGITINDLRPNRTADSGNSDHA
jgi:DNA-binding NarL/FixJ family response regulator